MALQIAKQLCPLRFVIVVKQAPARAFNPKPDAIAIHDAAYASEWQAVIAKCLAMTRSHHIDRLWPKRDDLLHPLDRLVFADRRKLL